jgi:hypothetical protein
MTATNHALTGVVIALVVKQPVLVIPLVFLAHFAMDAIPHFGAGPDSPKLAKIAIATDLIIATCLTFGLTIMLKDRVPWWLIFASASACMSPDLIWGWRYYKLRDLKKIISEPMSKFTRFHQKIQWSESRLGIAIELVWFALMLALAINVGK